MNGLKRILPNLITLANLTCGLFSIFFAFQANLEMASLCIFSGAFLDFFDGLTARLLKVSNELGKQLDSMADMVTFGVAPGFILFHFMFLEFIFLLHFKFLFLHFKLVFLQV